MTAAYAIKRIRPAVERVVTPQCCVTIYRNPAVPSVYWKHRQRMDEPKGFNSDQCARSSAFVIDGKHYCGLHAGQVALSILIQRDEASEQPA